MPGRALGSQGTLDELDGESRRDGEEQAAQALVARARKYPYD